MDVERSKDFKHALEIMELEDLLEVQLILQGIVMLKVKEIKEEVDELLENLNYMIS